MDTVKLPISKGLFTLIDDIDYKMLQATGNLKWNAQKSGKRFYVSKTIHGEGKLYLHRFIMNPKPGFCIDHINGDALDNRRSNLRVCSHRQNSYNVYKEGFKGVAATKNGKHTAQIEVHGSHINLGTFSGATDAARMYDLAAALLFGEFANFNFPFSEKFIKLRKYIK